MTRTLAYVAVVLAAVVGIACAAAPATRPAPAAQDPFSGFYSGTFRHTGAVVKGQVATRPNCAVCHAAAQVRFDPPDYLLTLSLATTNKDGKATIVALEGKAVGDKVVFQTAEYLLTASAGRLTGTRTGQKMVDALDLSLLPATRPGKSH